MDLTHSVLIWGWIHSAGVGSLGFTKPKSNGVVYQEILEHFMIPAADELCEDTDLIFQ